MSEIGIISLSKVEEDENFPISVIDMNYIYLYHRDKITVTNKECSISNAALYKICKTDTQAVKTLTKEDLEKNSIPQNWNNLATLKKDLLFTLRLQSHTLPLRYLLILNESVEYSYINKYIIIKLQKKIK